MELAEQLKKLWEKEDYVLQIDSHMRLRPNWDTYLIQALSICPSAIPGDNNSELDNIF